MGVKLRKVHLEFSTPATGSPVWQLSSSWLPQVMAWAMLRALGPETFRTAARTLVTDPAGGPSRRHLVTLSAAAGNFSPIGRGVRGGSCQGCPSRPRSWHPNGTNFKTLRPSRSLRLLAAPRKQAAPSSWWPDHATKPSGVTCTGNSLRPVDFRHIFKKQSLTVWLDVVIPRMRN